MRFVIVSLIINAIAVNINSLSVHPEYFSRYLSESDVFYLQLSLIFHHFIHDYYNNYNIYIQIIYYIFNYNN